MKKMLKIGRIFKIFLITSLLFWSAANSAFGKFVPSWQPISGNQYNMIVYGRINLVEAEGDLSSYRLFSFGPKGEADCRAQAAISSDGAYYLTILGNTPGETIQFKLYNQETGEVFNLEETIRFEIDVTIKDKDLHF